jgi:hypothetical protein
MVSGCLPIKYITCYVLYGDLIERNLNRSTEVVFIFCAVAKLI